MSLFIQQYSPGSSLLAWTIPLHLAVPQCPLTINCGVSARLKVVNLWTCSLFMEWQRYWWGVSWQLVCESSPFVKLSSSFYDVGSTEGAGKENVDGSLSAKLAVPAAGADGKAALCNAEEVEAKDLAAAHKEDGGGLSEHQEQRKKQKQWRIPPAAPSFALLHQCVLCTSKCVRLACSSPDVCLACSSPNVRLACLRQMCTWHFYRQMCAFHRQTCASSSPDVRSCGWLVAI